MWVWQGTKSVKINVDVPVGEGEKELAVGFAVTESHFEITVYC
jgi:hypothetical protein